MSDIISITDETFVEEVEQSDLPVLIDFWAEWCGPCCTFSPVLEEVAPKYSGKVKVVKANIDENSIITKKYGVRGIPTIILLKQGNVEATKVGALTKSQLIAFLNSNL